MKQVNVQLLLTGNELMTGDIVDSNSAMIAHSLKDIGLAVNRKVTVADDIDLLVNEIKHICAQADVLIINGGLGPTIDDLTAQALSLASGLPIEEHSEALQHLTLWCKKRNAQLNTPNLKQTLLPKGCHIIANKKGSAVGFHINFLNCDIYCTPGVPHELKTMLIEEIIPQLTKFTAKDLQLKVTRLQVFGIGESSIQKLIDDNIKDWPSEVELGFRAGMPLLEVKLTTKTSQALVLKEKYLAKLQQLLGHHMISQIIEKPKTLAAHVISLLSQQKSTLTLAESCTGGLIASQITQVSGASSVFEAGYVTYSNNIKSKILSVNPETLKNFGAVSKETVLEMAQGALELSGADLTIAVSGIAGPNGGTEEKPVGTVWIAWGNKSQLHCKCFLIPSSRTLFQQYVAAIGLDLIRRLLIQSDEIPFYVQERAIK